MLRFSFMLRHLERVYYVSVKFWSGKSFHLCQFMKSGIKDKNRTFNSNVINTRTEMSGGKVSQSPLSILSRIAHNNPLNPTLGYSSHKKVSKL